MECFKLVVSNGAKKLILIVAVCIGSMMMAPSGFASEVSFVSKFDPDSEWSRRPEFRERAEQVLADIGAQILSYNGDATVRVYFTDHINGYAISDSPARVRMLDVVFGGRRYAAPSPWVKLVLGRKNLSRLKTLRGIDGGYDIRFILNFESNENIELLRDTLTHEIVRTLGQIGWSNDILPAKDAEDATLIPSKSRMKATIFDRFVFDANGKPMLDRRGSCQFNDHRALGRATNDDWSENSSGFHFEGIDDFGNPVAMALSSNNASRSEDGIGSNIGFLSPSDLRLTVESAEGLLHERVRMFLRGLGYRIVHLGSVYGRDVAADAALHTSCGPWQNLPVQWSPRKVQTALNACEQYCLDRIARLSNRRWPFLQLVDSHGARAGYLADAFLTLPVIRKLGKSVTYLILHENEEEFRALRARSTSPGALVWSVAQVEFNRSLSDSEKSARHKGLTTQYGVELALVQRIAQTMRDSRFFEPLVPVVNAAHGNNGGFSTPVSSP